MKKSSTVVTNDPHRPEFELIMQGDVENFASITPTHLRLHGTIGEKIFGKVEILPSEKYPFKIIGVKAQDGKHINYHLEKDPRNNHSGYTLIVENLLEQKGRYSDTILFKTDSKIRPAFTVKVFGNILEKPYENKKTKQINND